MTVTYTFDVFSSLDGYGSYSELGDWGGYWASKAQSFSITASIYTVRSSGWCSGPTLSGNSCS